MFENFTDQLLHMYEIVVHSGRQKTRQGLDRLGDDYKRIKTHCFSLVWNGWARPNARLLMLIQFRLPVALICVSLLIIISQVKAVRAQKFGLVAPDMVELPSGMYLMGSGKGEGYDDEHPQHEVAIAAFAIGKYEVTFAEWDLCVDAGGCLHKPDDHGRGRDTRPVINVSWEDAQAYVAWLSDVTEETYRLPTEAEWEYAARAGTTTQYAFGDEINQEQANFGLNVRKTRVVGSYPANNWDLHDMHGNVWEWVEDCHHDNYDGAPTDGSPWLQDGCSKPVLRGGSWVDLPEFLRSAGRYWSPPGFRHYFIGFRVAKTLPY